MPTVRSVTAASTAAGSIVNVSGSTSTNTGVAPHTATVFAAAAKVKDGTITSSPGPRPSASIPRCCPEVPEFTATTSRPSVSAAENSFSKVATSGPCATMPVASTRSTASRSSWPMIGFAGGIMSCSVTSDVTFLRDSGLVGLLVGGGGAVAEDEAGGAGPVLGGGDVAAVDDQLHAGHVLGAELAVLGMVGLDDHQVRR